MTLTIVETRTTVTKKMGEMCIAHQLPTHNGKCRNLHGHNYQVEITVSGPVSMDRNAGDSGMVIDFSTLKGLYTTHIHDYLDHSLMLGTIPLSWIRDTFSEEMASDGLLTKELADQLTVTFGKVAFISVPVTTAENLARWIFTRMDTALSQNGHQRVRMESVQVWETESGSATYSRVEREVR